MGYQMDQVEKVDLSEVEEGNSVQFTGTVDGKSVTLSVDIFKKTEEHFYALGFSIQRPDRGQPMVDTNLSERFFRFPLQGVIEPGDVTVDTVIATEDIAGQIDRLPNELWTPFHNWLCGA